MSYYLWQPFPVPAWLMKTTAAQKFIAEETRNSGAVNSALCVRIFRNRA